MRLKYSLIQSSTYCPVSSWFKPREDFKDEMRTFLQYGLPQRKSNFWVMKWNGCNIIKQNMDFLVLLSSTACRELICATFSPLLHVSALHLVSCQFSQTILSPCGCKQFRIDELCQEQHYSTLLWKCYICKGEIKASFTPGPAEGRLDQACLRK